MLEFLSGIILGVFTSISSWYILFHFLVPSIEFLPIVFKKETEGNPSGWRYRIKFQNKGYRDVHDIEILAKVRILGLRKAQSKIWRAIYIPVDDARIPKLSSQRRSTRKWVVVLLLDQIPHSTVSLLPKRIQKKFQEESVCLEDLMRLGTEATLQLFAFGYDSFSGARKLFESPLYSLGDIQEETGHSGKLKKSKTKEQKFKLKN